MLIAVLGWAGRAASGLLATAGSQPGTTANARPDVDTGSGVFANDTYQVPPVSRNPPALPQPETYAQAATWTTHNALYQQSVPAPVRCEVPHENLSHLTTAQLTTHLNQLTACLMRVFGPTLQKAGFTAVRPSVTIYSGEVATKCGDLPRRNAVYCAADQQIYYASDLPQLIPPQLRSTPFTTESIIAHEFGHSIQARSGILISEFALEDRESSQSKKDAMSRRIELQADCFAGQFLGSIRQSEGLTGSDLTNLTLLFHSFGDDELSGDPLESGNHGRGANRQHWVATGMASTSMGACNTFTASSSSTR